MSSAFENKSGKLNKYIFLILGELDLPFLTMLVVIVAPYEAMNLRQVACLQFHHFPPRYYNILNKLLVISICRGSQAGTLISLAIAGYLAFQHFSRAGSL